MEVTECRTKAAMEMRGCLCTEASQLRFEIFFDFVENIKKSYEPLLQFVIYGHSVFFNF